MRNWNFDLSPKENIVKVRGGWGYMPGIVPSAKTADFSKLLSEVPNKNKERVLEAIDFVHKYCSKSPGNICPDVPKEWETAYDMRPWTAFPERGF